MSKRNVQVGDHVAIRAGAYDDDPWVNAEVTGLLSVQFTCTAKVARDSGGLIEKTLFGFYRDEGVTWHFVN